MSSALIVFAKVPEAGRVKTRLTPDLDETEAADLYAAFLRDLLARYAGRGVDTRLYLAPRETDLRTGILKGVVPDAVSMHAQAGRDLGERMARAFLESFAAGYDRLVITGSDHPTLPGPFLDYAFESLSRPKSIVFGPAEDGGFYLLGMNDFYPELFRNMEYSHADVFSETLDRLPESEINVTILPYWYDVDTPEDLPRLAAELEAEPEVNPHTRSVLRRLAERHPWITLNGNAG